MNTSELAQTHGSAAIRIGELEEQITALRASHERLKEALERISTRCPTDASAYTVASVGDIARAALKDAP